MKQQINLLNDLPKWEKSLYPFSLLITSCAVLFVILMIFYTISYLEVSQKNSLMNSLLFQQKIATKQLNSLQSKILNSSSNSKEMTAIQNQIYQQTHAKSSNGSKQFYNILATLGDKISPNVWLNYINLNHYGKVIHLAGFAIQPQDAMSYVAALNKVSLFTETPFKLENIRNINKKNYLYVQINTLTNNHDGDQS